MAKCHNCGRTVDLPFKCRYCGGLFCEDCRLPPKHNCPGINLWASRSPPSDLKGEDGRYIPVKVKPSTSYVRTTRRRKKKSNKLKVLVFLLLVVSVGIGLYYNNNKNFSFLTGNNGLGLVLSNITQHKITVNVKEYISKAKESVEKPLQEVIREPSKEEIMNETISAVLEYLNKERVKRGLPPVKLMLTGIAQFRADDMIKRDYFGHYDPEGYPPFYYYTKKGGIYAMEENCGMHEIISGTLSPTKIPKYAVNSVRNMIYNDTLSNWGHRNSLLDPSNNYVDIGVSWNSNRMVIVIHMIKKHVKWIKPPKVKDMVFSASGKLDPDVEFYEVLVYYHPPPKKEFSNRHSYSIGNPVAGVIPGRAYFKNIETWRPIKWFVTDQKFDISFKIKPIKGSGFYTVVIWVKNKSGLKHPFDPKRNDHWAILEYTIFVK